MIVAVRNGRRVVRRVRNPNDSRGLTGVPRSADSASKYLRDCADRALRVLEERDLGLVPAPGAAAAARVTVAVAARGAAPDRHVASLVVAVARLRPDVRAGQRDLAVGRDVEARPAHRTGRSASVGWMRASTATLTG